MAFVDLRADCADGSGSGSSFSTEQENVMANENPRQNVMSVELAIKRELAYRRKVEKLQLQPRGGIKEAPMHSQGPPPAPSPSLVGMKRKAPSSNLQCVPPQQSRPSNGYQSLQNHSVNLFCKICQVPCSSAISLKQHREGSKHRAKLQELQESGKNVGENGGPQHWCKVCSVMCGNEYSFLQHVTGKKHTTRVQTIEISKRSKEEAEREALKVKWDELEWEMVV